MLKRIIVFYIILAISITSGCSDNTENYLMPKDVELTVNIKPFESTWEEYFFTDLPLPHYLSLQNNKSTLKNKVIIEVKWKVRPDKVGEGSGLYPAPYIIIAPPKTPPKSNWHNYGYPKYAPHYKLAGIHHDVLTNVLLKKFPDYKWDKIPTQHIMHVNSFGQRFATCAYRLNHINDEYSQELWHPPTDYNEFKIFFVYYNSNNKNGWVKVISCILDK